MASKKIPHVDYRKCMACGSCIPACPFGCLDLTMQGLESYRKAYPELAYPDSCTGCGLCARACPVDCIEII
jgi:Na+-translocating ferredoxin:NAD+ oxidoreductase subunit B